MIRVTIEGLGETVEQATADLHRQVRSLVIAPVAPPAPEEETLPLPFPEPDVPSTFDRALDAARTFAEAHGTEALQSVLQKFQVKRVSEISEQALPTFLKVLNEGAQ